MTYVRGEAIQVDPGVVLTIEQARRRNAELNQHLANLAAERAAIDKSIRATSAQLTEAHKRLRRQLRDINTVRTQAEQIAAAKRFVSTLPEPIHGGTAGLDAATAEMLAHESKHLNLKKVPRRPAGPSCGTGRKYGLGCRCEKCKEWSRNKSARWRTNKKKRMADA